MAAPIEASLADVVHLAFRRSLGRLRAELDVMPLDRWNESVFRYFFCRAVAEKNPEVEQYVECGKIDLVLRLGREAAFVEFKFYQHPRRFDPYDGRDRGFKGGPGRKNLAEFQSCIDQLDGRRVEPGLSKFIVLVYADPPDGSRPRLRFARQYDGYQHPRTGVALRLVEAMDVPTMGKDIVRGQLIELGAVQER